MSVFKGTTRIAGIGSVHEHTNKILLDRFTDAEQGLSYNGVPLISSVSVSFKGVASNSSVRRQVLEVNGEDFEINGTAYMESNTHSTSSGFDVFTFTNSVITDNGLYDFANDKFGVAPASVTISGNTLTVKYRTSDGVSKVRVYIK